MFSIKDIDSKNKLAISLLLLQSIKAEYFICNCNMENFGSFLFKFRINIRKTIRLIESTDKKLINAELALLYNETCKNIHIYI